MFTLTAKLLCDQCGNHSYATGPKPLGDDMLRAGVVRENAARVRGFVRTEDGRDLCEFCRPSGPRED
jgi:hypothetical protein